jgi:hypothetical protein
MGSANFSVRGDWDSELPTTEYNRSLEAVRFGQRKDIALDTPDMCKFNTSSSQSAQSSPCNFTIGWEGHRSLQNFLLRFMSGSATEWDVDANAGSNTALQSDDEETDALWWSWTLQLRDTALPDRLAFVTGKHMNNVVRFMTNHVRQSFSSTLSGVEGQLYVFGTVNRERIFFDIKKHYAFYPGTLLVAAILFFAVTVLRTRTEPIWKNSQLALLYHGFAQDSGDHRGKLDTIAAMEGTGELVDAVLRDDQHDDSGLRLRVTGDAVPLTSTTQPTEPFSPTQPAGLFSPMQPTGHFSPTQPAAGHFSPAQPTGYFSPTQSTGYFSPVQSTGYFSPVQPTWQHHQEHYDLSERQDPYSDRR